MTEKPFTPRPIKETPVIHPDAFVAHWENEAYLRGRRTTPYLKGNYEIDPAGIFAVVAFLCLMGGIIVVMMGGFVAPALIVGGSLVAAGAGCLVLLRQTATPTPKKSRAITDGGSDGFGENSWGIQPTDLKRNWNSVSICIPYRQDYY